MIPGSDASRTEYTDPGKEVTAHFALGLWIKTTHKHLDSKSWTGHVNTALTHPAAELLPGPLLCLSAALPWAIQGWGQEERAWHCTVNHGKIQHCYFKSYELNNQYHSS